MTHPTLTSVGGVAERRVQTSKNITKPHVKKSRPVIEKQMR